MCSTGAITYRHIGLASTFIKNRIVNYLYLPIYVSYKAYNYYL